MNAGEGFERGGDGHGGSVVVALGIFTVWGVVIGMALGAWLW